MEIRFESTLFCAMLHLTPSMKLWSSNKPPFTSYITLTPASQWSRRKFMLIWCHMLHTSALASFPGPVWKSERGLVAFPCIFCWPLPLKLLRSQSDYRMKPRGMSSHHMRMKPKVPTMQCGRVARDGIVCVSYICPAEVSHLQEIGRQSKSESAVYPCRLLRQTPWSSVGLGPNQLRRSVRICV